PRSKNTKVNNFSCQFSNKTRTTCQELFFLSNFFLGAVRWDIDHEIARANPQPHNPECILVFLLPVYSRNSLDCSHPTVQTWWKKSDQQSGIVDLPCVYSKACNHRSSEVHLCHASSASPAYLLTPLRTCLHGEDSLGLQEVS
ncbi:hypothetical protein P4O66_009252, partial [Electrophorus voltai]